MFSGNPKNEGSDMLSVLSSLMPEHNRGYKYSIEDYSLFIRISNLFHKNQIKYNKMAAILNTLYV